MRKITTIILAMILSGMIQSCEEGFLERNPVGSFGDNVLTTSSGIETLLIGAYDSFHGRVIYALPMNPQRASLSGGEAYKGSDPGDIAVTLEFSQFNLTTNNQRMTWNWEWQWQGITRANDVLRMVKESDATDERKITIEAEARFIRGLFYLWTKLHWGNVPWIDETATDVRVSNYDESGNYINIWPQITADFDFARKNLPETWTEVGRPNSWAADCYYAKVLMFRAGEGEYPNGYSEALTILNNAINNGITSSGEHYDLLPYYHSNFDPAFDDSPESVWQVQHTVNDGTPGGWSGSPNGIAAGRSWSSTNASGPGLGLGYGNFQPTEWFVNHFRTDPNGLPYLDMFDTNPYEIKDDYLLPAAPVGQPDPFIPDTCGLDPRLDWTVGRRGIPFLDYGPMPGSIWLRNQTHGGPYFYKKFQIRKDKMGIYTGDGNAHAATNYSFIRFADVLLLAAECAVHEDQLDLARTYVNRVRQRMVDNADHPENWVKLADGVTNAANYRIDIYPTGGPKDPFGSSESALEAVLYERSLELGIEGQRYFDLVRFGKDVEEINGFLENAKKRFDYLNEATYDVPKDRLLPIPVDAVDLSLKDGVLTLKQNPGY